MRLHLIAGREESWPSLCEMELTIDHEAVDKFATKKIIGQSCK